MKWFSNMKIGQKLAMLFAIVMILIVGSNIMNFNMLIVTLMTLVIVIIGSFYLVRGITAPLNNLIAMIKDIAIDERDLTVRLGIDPQDEPGELATWFDTFV